MYIAFFVTTIQNMISRRLSRIKTVKALYSHYKSGQENLSFSEGEFRTGVRKCYELYLLLLQLIVEVADYAEKRIEIAASKLMPTQEDLYPNRRFVDNEVIRVLRESRELSDALTRAKLAWKGQEQIIKSLYEAMTAAAYYKKYMALDPVSFADDRKIVTGFYQNHLEDNEQLEAVLEDMSMFWVDDVAFAASHVISTIGALRSPADRLQILPMYKNDDDRQYTETLFNKSLVNAGEYMGYIDELTENWDFERIAFMDKMIMLAAITELTQFPTIPVKVTLDEFIEISKYYSTAGSSVFINGILDKAIEKLTAEGKIAKSGRGLIETSIK